MNMDRLFPVLEASKRLWRNRRVTLLVALSLALGIGANTAIFSFVDAIFLEPMALRDPNRVISLIAADPKNSLIRSFSYPNYCDIRCKAKSFENLAACGAFMVNVDVDGELRRIESQIVTDNFFDTAGVAPELGKLFHSDPEGESADVLPVVVSHTFWQKSLRGDPGILGKTVLLNKTPFQIAAVMPRPFRGFERMSSAELWVPMRASRYFLERPEWLSSRRALLLSVFGRLKDGVTFEQAEREIAGFQQSLLKEYPAANRGRTFRMLPLQEAALGPMFREQIRRMAFLLMGAASLVLLIAIANVGNVLLARASVRRREMAVRLALGATNRQLLGQVFWDSVLLILGGGAIGLLLGVAGWKVLWSFRPEFWADSVAPHINWRIVTFAALLSVITGTLANLLPALRTLRGNITRELRDRNAGASQGRFRMREVLVVCQVALSMIALVGADLFLKSLRNAESIDHGFEEKTLAAVEVNPRALAVRPEGRIELYEQLRTGLARVPGVLSATIASHAPYSPDRLSRTVLTSEGQQQGAAAVVMIGTGFFETTGILILRGRDITLEDRGRAPLIAIVNESMAARYWPNGNPIGGKFRFFGDPEDRTVIGVARDTASAYIGASAEPRAYLSLYQDDAPTAAITIRTEGDSRAYTAAVKRAVQQARPDMPIELSHVSDALKDALWWQRTAANLMLVFGALSLALAAIGVYSITANLVTRRTGEMGVRMAMGACPVDVVELVMRQCVSLILPGLAAGVVVSFGLARLLDKMLLGVRETDLEPYLYTSILLAAVALIASYLPARRVTRMAPLRALRQE